MDRQRAGARREGGDNRPDPAPFPADDGTPSMLADDRHSGQWHTQNGRGEGYGEAQRPSAPGQWPRESPPPPRRTPLDNRSTSWAGWAHKTASSGRVFGAVAHLSKSRRTARRRYSITDRMPGMGDHRPRHRTWLDDQPTLQAVGTFDVCSNAAVNSDLFCSLYRGRLQCFDAVGWAAGRASGL